MKVLKPGVEVGTSQMPKLFAGQYSAEISALLGSERRRHPLQLLGRRPRGARSCRARRAGCSRSSTVILTAGETAMYKLGRPDPRRHGASARAARSARSRRTTRSTAGSARRTRSGTASPPNYAVLPDGAGDPRREGRVREGAGRQRRQAPEPGAGHRGLREPRRSKAPAARSRWRSARATRRSGDRLRHDQAASSGKLTVVNVKRYPAEKRESAGRREERRLDQGRLQEQRK